MSTRNAATEAAEPNFVRYTVAIPTVRHPKQLRSVINSVRSQSGIDLGLVEVLIVDNSPDGSARWVVEEYAAGQPAVRYVHEALAGPSHARNRAVAEARGQILVFLDDDETADANWLAALVNGLETSSADAAFGQVVACFEAVPERHVTLADGIYSRRIFAKPRADITRLHAQLGTGNSAFRIDRCFSGTTPFAVSVATAGGEDVMFLRGLVQSDRRFVWVPSAIVYEHVARNRLVPKALRARRFRQGQLRSLICVGARPNPLLVAAWMAVGLIQTLVQLVTWLTMAVSMRREARQRAGIEMAGGLGKMFWWLTSPTQYGGGGSAAAEPDATDRSYAFSRG